jgi:hypothetical protein
VRKAPAVWSEKNAKRTGSRPSPCGEFVGRTACYSALGDSPDD